MLISQKVVTKQRIMDQALQDRVEETRLPKIVKSPSTLDMVGDNFDDKKEHGTEKVFALP